MKERITIQHVIRQVHVLDDEFADNGALVVVDSAKVSSSVSLAPPVRMNSDEEFDEELAALTSPRYEITLEVINKEEIVPWSPPKMHGQRLPNDATDASEASPRTIRAKRAR